MVMVGSFFGQDVAEKRFYEAADLLPHDPFALVKCCESLAFLVRDVAHITPFNYKHCVHTLRTFVEATLYSGIGLFVDFRIYHYLCQACVFLEFVNV